MVERRGRPPESFSTMINKYRKTPVLWLEDTFGIDLWEKQEEIINTVWESRFTVVKSCYASGKSFTAACLAIAFVHLYPDSVVITTAPSYRQLDNIWNVVHQLKEKRKAQLGSRFLKHEIRCNPGHYAMGFTTNMPERVQGMHAANVMIIVDESAGIEPEINERLDALMTGENCYRLDIGNPLSPEGHFYEMFQQDRYSKITISAFDTPNLEAGKEVIPGLVTDIWVEEQREKYGVDSPVWKSQVEGEFPGVSEEGLIPLTWIEKAITRYENSEPNGEPRYGFDPSGAGLNSNVLCKRSGNFIEWLDEWQTAEPAQTAKRIKDRVGGFHEVYVDSIGAGWGVYHRIVEEGVNAISVNVKQTPEHDPDDRFLNLRAQLYWNLRESFDPEQSNPIAIPPDEELKSQLGNLKYETTSKGKIKLEPKDKMRKRGMQSPDKADALMLSEAGTSSDMVPLSEDVETMSEMMTLSSREPEFSYGSWEHGMKNL